MMKLHKQRKGREHVLYKVKIDQISNDLDLIMCISCFKTIQWLHSKNEVFFVKLFSSPYIRGLHYGVNFVVGLIYAADSTYI
jgi:hypothetical protein